MYKYFNDPREAETIKKLTDLEQINSADYFEAIKMPQHALINVIFLNYFLCTNRCDYSSIMYNLILVE